uniref:Uncharacterized protein n=1 Tax=Vespula pensylvanica TaxID=30213 RepID=A0A834UHD6_VESPE|nr:hypothetical protein H0235_001504 [Vespula pensylvanica]
MAYSACLRTQPNSSSHTKGPCCYGAAELSQGCDNLCWSRSTSDNIVWVYVSVSAVEISGTMLRNDLHMNASPSSVFRPDALPALHRMRGTNVLSREEKEEEEEEKKEEEEEEEEETSGQLPQSFAELLKSRGE